jgi:DUF4097 and DUF4098 domain-containing protein YvlB
MNRLNPVTGLLLASLILAPFASGLAETRSFQKKFPASAGGELVIDTQVGDIRIVGAAVSEVAVVAEIKGSTLEVQRFRVDALATNGGVKVTGESGKSGWWHFGARNLQVTYTVQVPEEFRLELGTSGGDIQVRNVRGRLNASTSGGDVDLHDIGGPATATTSGGDIDIARAMGNLRARTSGGDIKLSDVVGDAEVRTSGGDIRIRNVDGEVTAKTSGGDIDIGIAREHHGTDAETSGGSIELVMASDARADIDASTKGGEVRVNFPNTTQGSADKDEFRGQINGGGPGVRVRTSGGDIRIRAREAGL